MKQKLASIMVLLLLLVTIKGTVISTSRVSASLPVHNIDTGLDYATIQAAIDAPETLNGHTIKVDAGTYYESVNVFKQLTLVGEDRYSTVINASGTAVTIAASSASFSNFTITGDGTGNGIEVTYEPTTVKNCIIDNFNYGYMINGDYNSNFLDNCTVSSNFFGVLMLGSVIDSNTVTNNFIIDNDWGIGFEGDPSNHNNIIYNNYFDNTQNVYESDPGFNDNYWNTDYDCSSGPNLVGGPCVGGNYWSDYTGVDLYSGPYQNETGSDGIGDTPYVVSGGSNQDNYPLVELPVHNLNTSLNYPTIQWAIDAPETLDGHTIKVDAGTYHESLIVNKSLTILGEDQSSTIINASGFGNGIMVIHPTPDPIDVTISNFTVTGDGTGNGIEIRSDLTTVESCAISNFNNGYLVNIGYNINELKVSSLSHNYYGINIMQYAGVNSFIGNSITNNFWGVWLTSSAISNSITNNFITENSYGIGVVYDGENYENSVHNNYFDNTGQNIVETDPGWTPNHWNTSYDSSSGPNIVKGLYMGGNYWSDYTGVDLYSGPYQNETGSDGIGDTPYVISGEGENQDNYPLVPDLTPPEISILSPRSGATYYTESFFGPTTVSLTFTTDEPIVAAWYTVNDGRLTGVIDPIGNITLSIPWFGTSYLIVYATDTSGNEGSSAITKFFTIYRGGGGASGTGGAGA